MGEDEVVEFSDFQIKNEQTVMEGHYVIRDLTLTYAPVRTLLKFASKFFSNDVFDLTPQGKVNFLISGRFYLIF